MNPAALILMLAPGFVVIYLLGGRSRARPTVSEMLVLGPFLWYAFFVFCAVVIGSFTDYLGFFFTLYQIVSGLLTLGVPPIAYRERAHLRDFAVNDLFSSGILLAGLLVMLTVVVSGIVFSSLLLQWDAVSTYIPAAKAIIATGGITADPFRMLGFLEVSPAVPLTYASVISVYGVDSLSVVPLAFLYLTCSTVYLITKELRPRISPVSSVLIFLSIPSVTIVFFSRSLYLDVGFVSSLMIALYSSIRLANDSSGQEAGWYLIPFVWSCALAILVRTDLGLLILPVFAVMLLLLYLPSRWRLPSLLLVGASYYAREARNIVLDPSQFAYYIERLVPVVILTTVLLVLSTARAKLRLPKLPRKIVITAALCGIAAPAIYMGLSLGINGFIIPSIPFTSGTLFRAISEFRIFFPSIPNTLFDLMRWDYLIETWWFLPPLAIPFALYLWYSVKKIREGSEIPTSVLLGLTLLIGVLILWCELPSDPQPRRLYLMSPFLAIAATIGLSQLSRFYENRGLTVRATCFAILLMAYTLHRIGAATVNDVSLYYANMYVPQITIEDIIVTLLLFIVSFAPYGWVSSKLGEANHLPIRESAKKLAVPFVVILILVSSVAGPMISDAVVAGDLRRSEYYSGWNDYPDVVEYYNTNVHDNYTTLTFFGGDLITFANRTVIDLYDPVFGSPVYSSIGDRKVDLVGLFRRLNIGYILVPNVGTQWYPAFSAVANGTALGGLISDNFYCIQVRSFKQVTLYRFYSQSTVRAANAKSEQLWNYDPSYNYSLIVLNDSIMVKGVAESNGALSVMFLFNPAADAGDAIKMIVNVGLSCNLTVSLYSEMTNRSDQFYRYKTSLPQGESTVVLPYGLFASVGAADSKHIEGIQVGIAVGPGSYGEFSIQGLSYVDYG